MRKSELETDSKILQKLHKCHSFILHTYICICLFILNLLFLLINKYMHVKYLNELVFN